MPRYRIYFKEAFDAPTGQFQDWDLPWLRLVFDQKFDHTLPGKSEAGRFVVTAIKKDGQGEFFEVAPVVAKKKGAL